MPRFSPHRRGSTLIESALVFLLFLSLSFGILDLGRYIYVQHSLAERVRSVARSAAVNEYSPDQIANLIARGGYLGLTPANVSVSVSPDRCLVVVVRNLPVAAFTPLLPRVLTSLPVRIATPLETP